MKQLGKYACKAAVFLALIAVCLHFMTDTFRMKDESYMASDFYHYKKGSFDVIEIGTSLIQYGVYPMQMWDEYGITSYNLGAGNETMASSYYLAREAIRKQHPKLIVLACGSIYKNEKIRSSEWLHHVTDAMPVLSPNRIRMILDLTENEREALLLPLERYHMRWTDLTETDFQEEYQNATYGSVLMMKSNAYEEFERHDIDTENAIAEIPMEYLEKTIALCQDTDTELLLLVMPVIGPGYMMDQTEYDQRRNAAYALEEYCSEKGIDCLNMTDSVTDLDLSGHTVDGEHLNMKGAAKLTSYLGSYLKEHYDLADRREDASAAFMAREYEEYKEVYQEMRFTTCNQAEDYVDALCDESFSDRYLFVLEGNAYGESLSEETAAQCRRLGITEDLTAERNDAYAVVRSGGEILYESSTGAGTVVDETVQADDIEVRVCCDMDNSANCSVTIDGEAYSLENPGFNLIVYDKVRREVIDSAAAWDRGIR